MSNSRHLPRSWHRSISTTSPSGRSSSAPARPSAWRPETRPPKTQKNDNMLVLLFGLSVLRRDYGDAPVGLRRCERAAGDAAPTITPNSEEPTFCPALQPVSLSL